MSENRKTLIGVYKADGGILGELSYFFGHLVGIKSCSLCDITHSPVRRKRAWDAMVAELDAPFDLRHRNELTKVETLALTPMGLPVVAAELADGRWVELLGRDALDACGGDVDTFARVLRAAVADHAA